MNMMRKDVRVAEVQENVDMGLFVLLQTFNCEANATYNQMKILVLEATTSQKASLVVVGNETKVFVNLNPLQSEAFLELITRNNMKLEYTTSSSFIIKDFFKTLNTLTFLAKVEDLDDVNLFGTFLMKKLLLDFT